MLIQEYRLERAREIADLFHSAVHAIDNRLYDAEQKEAWAPTPPDYALWANRLDLKRPFLAILDGRVAGFIELDPDGHIDCTYTHPGFQRRGIATSLYRHLEGEAQSRGMSRLYVEASEIALPFFEKHGFSLIRQNRLERGGVMLINYTMEKFL
ncbi:GNAT family N-acetyltransferase [Hahella ganghwensis]|uniref:GNAT family N-acetyltransferase n=1 Tax=Hahella ganghwensis TaxID=286420 RepID=UPI00037C1724|nr:GNAT family N-acetyltransferase [Hahella ganghwensis]